MELWRLGSSIPVTGALPCIEYVLCKVSKAMEDEFIVMLAWFKDFGVLHKGIQRSLFQLA